MGSLIALTEENGTVVERYAYDPWGARRNPDNWTLTDTRTSWIVNRGYTGHEHLDAFGIINMNGRVYDPLTAMFFSPDPYVQAPGNWLNYNRYGYCFGNPLKYTDPSGYRFWDPFIWVARFIVNTVVTAVALGVGMVCIYGGLALGAALGTIGLGVPGVLIGAFTGFYVGLEASIWVIETFWWREKN